MDMREYVAGAAWSREDVTAFLDRNSPGWARFDPDTGYALDDIRIRDGIDGSHTLNSYTSDGARTMTCYADAPCRIETFGDSFTQCHQVSDGETWQEVLAAHLGEPVRNFGVGGFGVYQAFCRIERRAMDASLAPYVVLNIYDDDHVRNIDAARWFRLAEFRKWFAAGVRPMLHANPWRHLRYDVDAAAWTDRPNVMPTPESLYGFADPDTLLDLFGGDEVVALECLRLGIDVSSKELLARLDALAAWLGVAFDRSPQTAAGILDAYGMRATLHTVDRVSRRVSDAGGRLLVLLSYGPDRVQEHLEGTTSRFDQELLDHLDAQGLAYVDALAAHATDYTDFSLDPHSYCRRYFHGHYSPIGNAFFAFAVKDAFARWLVPPPRTYPGAGASFATGVGLLA